MSESQLTAVFPPRFHPWVNAIAASCRCIQLVDRHSVAFPSPSAGLPRSSERSRPGAPTAGKLVRLVRLRLHGVESKKGLPPPVLAWRALMMSSGLAVAVV